MNNDDSTPESAPDTAPASNDDHEATALPPPPMPIESFLVSPYAVAPHGAELEAAIAHVETLPESSKREAVLANLRAGKYERACDMLADIDDLDQHAEGVAVAQSSE
jgi:hypothetical protein